MAEYVRPKEMRFFTTRLEAYVNNWTEILFNKEKSLVNPLNNSIMLTLCICIISFITIIALSEQVLVSMILTLILGFISMIVMREAYLKLYKSIKFKEYSVEVKLDETKITIKDSREEESKIIQYKDIKAIDYGFETDWDDKMVFYILIATAYGDNQYKLACLDDSGRDIMLALCDYSGVQQPGYLR